MARPLPIGSGLDGADGRIRTDDLVFTKHLLCQLSYIGPEPCLARRLPGRVTAESIA